MRINVICSNCNKTFEWKWGKQTGTCEHCETALNVKEVKMAEGEFLKLFQ